MSNFSLEFFPPKTDEGRNKLKLVREKLVTTIDPAYISVTFGAGGSTRDGTFTTVQEIQQSGTAAAPHLSCIGSSQESITEILDSYLDIGVNRIVALRGDMPSGMQEPGDFRFANELVEFIRSKYDDKFILEVAAYPEFHPQADDAFTDLKNFQRKVNAGADGAITQYFYNLEAYLRFIDGCEKLGITIPIVPGIMPITNYTNLARFSKMCGAEIPRWIAKRLEAYGEDKESLQAFGLDVTTKLCQQLLDAGAPGLHFYTMNQSKATLAIWNNLNLEN